MSELAISHLSGGYGNLCVFRDATIDLAAGETVGIYGPNGAGKTTLLSTIAGLLPAMSGTVGLRGTDLSPLPAFHRARQGLALVPEGRQILSTLTVDDNLQLARAANRADAGFDDRLNETLDLFPRLRERSQQLGGSLSGGEQQMLAIARALLINPRVLMLDEPTQGLAPVVVKSLAETLRRLRGRFAMIIVEQNRDFLDGLADRSITMRAGNCQPG